MMFGTIEDAMDRVPMLRIAPRSVGEVFTMVERVHRERGIAYLVPGDLHLWGAKGGNRSELFFRLLTDVAYRKVVILGDLLDGNRHERETLSDRHVLEHLRRLDEQGRLHLVRGNHDRVLMRSPGLIANRHRRRRVLGEVGEPMDMQWLARPRMHDDVLYAYVDGVEYTLPGGIDRAKGDHPGSSDVLVLRVRDKNILFEHGDAYDHLVRRTRAGSVFTSVGKCAYDLLVRMEKNHASLADLSGTLKQKVSMWRGVCHAVAVGTHARGVSLSYPIHASVSGHTHYPGYVRFGEVPYVNVGSFRGHRPSFTLVTEHGEVLPPIVVHCGRE